MKEPTHEVVAEAKPGFSLGAALGARRRERGLSRREVSRRTGIRDWALRNYEAGEAEPAKEELARLASCLETTPARLWAEGELLAAFQSVGGEAPLAPAHMILRLGEDFTAALVEAAKAMALPAARPCPEEAGPERRLAADSWQRLEPLSPEERRQALGGEPILRNPLFQRWGLAERLCLESDAVAASDPGRAVHLGELALYVAERVAGAPSWRNHLQGYAWAFIARAKLAGGDRPGAEQAFESCRSFWQPSVALETGVLDTAPLEDLAIRLR